MKKLVNKKIKSLIKKIIKCNNQERLSFLQDKLNLLQEFKRSSK